MGNTKLLEEWSSEFSYWLSRFGSAPVELVRSKDCSQSYEMDRRHIFKLENGQYAVVKEDGCSCYSSSEADIQLFSDLQMANDCFEDGDKLKWGVN